MTDDLVAWLRGVLDEDEAVALAANQAYRYAPDAQPPATGVHWRFVSGDQWETVDLDNGDEYVADGDPCHLATVEEWRDDRYGDDMPRTYDGGIDELDPAAARHIVAHDPASVLADIEAKRAVIDLHVCSCPDPDCRDCGECSGAHHADPTPAPCQTLRLLASAYRHRPGYRQEWAP